LQHGRTERTEDVVKRGDRVRVKLLEVTSAAACACRGRRCSSAGAGALAVDGDRPCSTGRSSKLESPRLTVCPSAWRASLAAVGVWVRTASAHESRGTMGVSHLLEHMVFKAPSAAPRKEIALALEARGGSLDAYTARDTTAFHARVSTPTCPSARTYHRSGAPAGAAGL